MKTIIVGTQYPDKAIPLRGTYFYVEELAQYWYDHVCTGVEVCLTRSGINVSSRYMWTAPRYNSNESWCDVLILNWVHNIREVDINLFRSAKYVFFVNSANLDAFMEQSYNLSLDVINLVRNKSYLLLEPGFETKTINFAIFRDRILPIRRGFYFKHYSPGKPLQTENWFLYSNDYMTQDKEIHVNNRSVIIAKNYCKQHKLPYVQDLYESANPGNHYAGLLYTRFRDYMPRLPYEFWFYGKPVVLCDISDGLYRRGITNDMKFKEVVMPIELIPTWDITSVRDLLQM